jgi:hypothetical protein
MKNPSMQKLLAEKKESGKDIQQIEKATKTEVNYITWKITALHINLRRLL